jgi:RNA 3'-terminal phosphate cyclase (ATP)
MPRPRRGAGSERLRALRWLALAIAEREIAVVRKDLGWSERESYVRELPEDHGPGNILLLEARFSHATEIVSGFGRLGVTAESLARQACARMRGYLACDAFAGPYLADQLLLPMAVAGSGVFTTVKPSEHARTAAAVIERFTGKRTSFVQQEGGEHLVTVA